MNSKKIEENIDNIILIRNPEILMPSKKNKQLLYNDILFSGRNVQSFITDNDKININLSTNEHNGHIIVVTTIKSFQNDSNVLLLDMDFSEVTDDNHYPVLLSIIFGKRNVNRDYFAKIKNMKRNTTVGDQKHFGSIGLSYGFGLRSLYRLDDNKLSFGPYHMKKKPNIKKHENNDKLLVSVSEGLNEEVEITISEHQKILPNYIFMSNGILTSIYTTMNQFKHEKYSNIRNNIYALFSSRYIHVDSATKYYHNDNDAGSTIISVPKQEKERLGNAQFSFKFNESTYLLIPMVEGVSIHFHGSYITHCRQIFNKSFFINIS